MRTKGARDTAKRKPRRQMTVAEKVVQQRKSNATKEKTKKQQKEEAERARPAREFFSRRSTKQPATTGEEMSDDNSNNNDTINCNDIGAGRATVEVQNEDVWHDDDDDDDDEQHNASQQHDGPIQSEDEVITIDSNITPKEVTPKEVVATLDCEEDDEDGRDEYDVDEDDDGNITDNVNDEKQSKSGGVMREVLKAVQDRLKWEKSPRCKGFNEAWLLKFLEEHDWSIPRNQIPKLVRKLGLQHDTALFKYYYTRLDVWMPELRWGHMHMPCCPNCKRNNAVGVHGYPVHPGRLVVGLQENYYILGRRYICSDCKGEKKRLTSLATKAAMAAAAATAAGTNVEVQVTKVNLQVTFMGWDRRILPLFPDGRGKQFPAFLTKRSGMCNSLIDLMRPMFNKSARPQFFSDLLLELHAKEWTRRYIMYEREVAMRERLSPGFAKTAPEFCDFGDTAYYEDGKVPTGRFIQLVYCLYHDTISVHMDKEVKKRPCNVLYWDVSYKSSKRMNQYKGEQIFKGLVTGMNEHGEIRIQFHIHTDSHDQMVAALEAFKATNEKFGMKGPKYFVTDNPTADAAFFSNIFDFLMQQQQQQQQQLNNELSVNNAIPSLSEECFVRDDVKVIDTAAETNTAITAMCDVAKGKSFGLDAEWNVTLNRHGHVMNTGKVALIQLSYIDGNDKMTTLLIQTHHMTRLPFKLEWLLANNAFKIVGVNVSADLIKIGKDFNVDAIKQVTQKDRHNVINLGAFARKRGVVTSGAASLQQLSELVLKARLNKATNIRFSNWNQNQLSVEQVEYAALDAIASLKIFSKLDEMPDLTHRYTMNDVCVGNKVDLVPIHGSVFCMSTRAATGIIVDVDCCESPDDVTPRLARAGNGTVAIKIIKIYSRGFKVPSYKYQPSGSEASPATLLHFREDCQIVVPVHMLKQHVDSDHICSTPAEINPPSIPNITAPVEQYDIPPADQDEGDVTDEASVDNDRVEVVLNSLHDEDFLVTGISQLDIELVRAAQEQDQSKTMPSVANLFPCEELPQSPSPTDIPNVYSFVLGDTFHAMKRTITSTQHEANKAFFVALRNAFFMWDKEKLEELMVHMREDGMTQEEIDNKMLFSPTLFTDCVPRYIPPGSLLYFRVRAVFVLFGNMKDSKSKKPLFNKKAWRCAKNVLREILLGYYSDPPGVQWFTKRLKKDGVVATNKYGMDLLDCSRGTNRVESFHKDLITDWGSWNLGMEMSVKLLREKRHRHNQRVSEKRRDGYPKIGHYDTWEVDELQSLVLKTRGYLLFPNWSNSSEYVTTEESFDVVALQSKDVQEALEARCQELEERGALPKLTRELQFQCKAMGTPLPLLPFSNDEERMQFSTYVHELKSPVSTIDDRKAAADWNRSYVDGINIWPKLPCHIRTYLRKWERGQRCKDVFISSRSGREKLDELNSIEPAATADAPSYQSIPIPPQMPQPEPAALHNQPYTIVANSVIGEIPLSSSHKRKRGERGKDADHRKPRRCLTCMHNDGPFFESCKGRWPRSTCQYFST